MGVRGSGLSPGAATGEPVTVGQEGWPFSASVSPVEKGVVLSLGPVVRVQSKTAALGRGRQEVGGLTREMAETPTEPRNTL